MSSPQGGVDIEEVAHNTPALIFKEPVDVSLGLSPAQASRVAMNLGFTGEKKREAEKQIQRLYDLFVGVDASQVEVNPFGETPDGRGM